MSEIKVDTLTGKTTAKTVTVTVGASATQSLEQGLAKAWFSLDGDAGTPVFFDSFNCASITDTSGKPKIHFTNHMANDDFAASGLSGQDNGASLSFEGNTPKTTDTVIYRTMNASFSVGDTTNLDSIIMGDLA